jgi:6-phosphogluconolactonase
MLTDSLSLTRWHIAADAEDWLAQALAFVSAAEIEALAARDEFHIVLAGGGTPRRLYQALSSEAHNWSRWRVWFGDERCLPPDDPERNSTMAREVWLDKVDLPDGNLHVIPAELDADQAARRYARELTGVADFDLVLLGLGQDGHTASLFPGKEWGAEEASVLAVKDAPKPPPQRVSLSAGRLSRARRVLFLVNGVDKRDALERWRRGENLPAAAIRPLTGVDVLMDRAAGA